MKISIENIFLTHMSLHNDSDSNKTNRKKKLKISDRKFYLKIAMFGNTVSMQLLYICEYMSSLLLPIFVLV